MTVASRMDQLVESLNRHRMEAEYEPESSPAWARVVEEWLVFKLLVDILDHAVRNPFAERSAVVLSTAYTVLLGLEAVELYSWLSNAGEAIRFALAPSALPAGKEQP